MSNKAGTETSARILELNDLAKAADYSLLDSLVPDPDATKDGLDFYPRQVFSGHYVPVMPTPIADPVYIAHSQKLFRELGLDDRLAKTEAFKQLFSGDVTNVPAPMRTIGWATGYALSIFGNEYIDQCPFKTGNGYGDGRAVSVFEGVLNGKRWEMQLKGGGPTPYCRGADGRAVLRSSVREFLAQEYMNALGIPTSRSLSLFASQTETVDRPWYSEGSRSENPDIMIANPIAISTRVAPSFLRVGQLELFSRRARVNEHPNAMAELEMMVLHIIEREYKQQIDSSLPLAEKILFLANEFRDRLTSLIANWLRVGYCQGNFNSDNCSVGGFTLDYGPFGFCEYFEPFFQPWTGGGRHFAFLNQSQAAEKNFETFCGALKPLLQSQPDALEKLEQVVEGFSSVMQAKASRMWASKLGLEALNSDLFNQLLALMIKSHVDYTIFFRELSKIPTEVSDLSACFYAQLSEELELAWSQWLKSWRELLSSAGEKSLEDVSRQMKQVNPKYTWREWLIVPAYEQAQKGDFSLIQELQSILANPYDEQSEEIEAKYYQLRPMEYFAAGGVSHYSCSS
ncbi:protein adenylyltransferase SelO family protein [Vibrio europaeus]|uniref:Protein nucleotidyltransferase YdiU n=1 Tax=Vibrio europaeus TaxID=300876 RepID=A0A178JFZ4_9VIBR|nr:protein adenylyltransferase SelO family protein [Vibrio europaeus]MDC5707264.1 protein adenylyltransferase SelO family protein [Vibrio europaeus]MDC5712629.1 protein adenylyltransferase SelO family protein [Vibrio europaeus]MDC5717272.1 protein adenylyltransferase SelO family protein [Vibrio europaeus]MDC5721194.1 protein adenylyltransferase SelO family protein [Vibrio europaeus]MDC5726572.1 protein adenylyltransferase SelO family protein [Vibrio europaeus]